MAISNSLNAINTQIKAIEALTNYYGRVHRAIEAADTALKGLEEMFHDSIGEVCPLCNQKIEL